jgi:hypothetical protein
VSVTLLSALAAGGPIMAATTASVVATSKRNGRLATLPMTASPVLGGELNSTVPVEDGTPVFLLTPAAVVRCDIVRVKGEVSQVQGPQAPARMPRPSGRHCSTRPTLD